MLPFLGAEVNHDGLDPYGSITRGCLLTVIKLCRTPSIDHKRENETVVSRVIFPNLMFVKVLVQGFSGHGYITSKVNRLVESPAPWATSTPINLCWHFH